MLSNKEIQTTVNSIPKERWEKSLKLDSVRVVNVEEIRTLPNSYIIRCRISTNSVEKGVYVKIIRKVEKVDQKDPIIEAKNEYDNLVFWQEKFKGEEKFRTVNPLFFLPDQLLIATEEAIGKTLSQCLVDIKLFPSSQQLSETLYYLKNVGKWQQHFQKVAKAPDLQFSHDWIKEYLDVRLKELTNDKRRKFPCFYRDKILNYIDRKWPDLTEKELKMNLSHGDFALGNIIINSDTITVLDFGNVVSDSFLLDISRVYHQLFLMTIKPVYRKKNIEKLQTSLLEGFGIPEARTLTMFRILLIRNTLTHLVTITRFWKKDFVERTYNSLVLKKELVLLDQLLNT